MRRTERFISNLPTPIRSRAKAIRKKNKLLESVYVKAFHKEPPHTLWFDDGYEEDYTVIFPLLQKRNIQGILAICTSEIGHNGFLKVDQIKEMMNAGWKIASHSVTHRDFLGLSLLEVEQELKMSKEWIQQNLFVEPKSFMPPFGLVNITKAQKKLALKYYPSLCKEKYHFHSRHFQGNNLNLLGGKMSPITAEHEREMLDKIIKKIDTESPFFQANINDLKFPPLPKLPVGYTLQVMKGKEVNPTFRDAWIQLNDAEPQGWYVPDDATIFFITYKNEVVATEFVFGRNGIGALHAGYVMPQHRKQRLYTLMGLLGIQQLISEGCTIFELHTGVKRIWHFWNVTMGFRRVAKVSPHARGNAFDEFRRA